MISEAFIVDPMIHPALLLLAAVLAAGAVGFRMLRAASASQVAAGIGRVLMVLLLAGILLRPGLTIQNQAVQATQADIFLVVDTTASVAAEDWSGTEPRLAAIRTDIAALVGELAGARFELITFDRTAVLRVPLTSDAASVLSAVEVLQPEISGQSGGSSIGMAARLLHDQLRVTAGESPERARAAYYFGDGEQTAVTTAESFADSAQYLGGGAVWGYGGTAGGAMKSNDGRAGEATAYILDPRTGEPALSRLDPAALGTIATQLGVPFELRDPSSDARAGDVRGSRVTGDGTLSSAGVTELYWIPALLLFGLLVGEFTLIVRALLASGRGRNLR